MERALYIRALPPGEFAQRLAACSQPIFSNVSVDFMVSTNLEGIGLSLGGVNGAALASDGRLTQFRDTCTPHPQLMCFAAHLKQSNPNNTPQNPFQVTYNSADGVLGKFTFNGHPGNAEWPYQALAAIEANFDVTSYADLVGAHAPTVAERAALQMRERSVADLREQLRELSEFLISLTKQEAEARQKLQTELEGAYREKQAELEKQHLERQAALDARQKAQDDDLAARTKAFEAREKEFETRESKLVRRALLEEIKQVLQEAETLTLSKATAGKRTLNHVVVIALLVFSLGVAGLMLVLIWRVPDGTEPSWRLLGPLAAASVTFVSSAIYYLKWNDRWFREHADGELAAKRFKSDILRASWLAELVSEMATEGRPELPTELLDAFTRNLFRDVGTSRVSEHPFDDLTSMFKRAKELTIGTKGFALKAEKETRREIESKSGRPE